MIKKYVGMSDGKNEILDYVWHLCPSVTPNPSGVDFQMGKGKMSLFGVNQIVIRPIPFDISLGVT